MSTSRFAWCAVRQDTVMAQARQGQAAIPPATGHLTIMMIAGCTALQKVELKAAKVVHVGTCDNSAGNYALAKKKMSMEVNDLIWHYSCHALKHHTLSWFWSGRRSGFTTMKSTRMHFKLQSLRLERSAGARLETGRSWPARGCGD